MDLEPCGDWFGIMRDAQTAKPQKSEQPEQTIMGKLVITIGAGDPQGNQFHDVEVTVDTGSTFTALPGSMLREMGVPIERTAQARLADGSSKSIEIGHTMVRLEGRTFPTPVIFAGPAEPSLLGVVTLGDALLAVDTDGQRLIPVDADQL